MGPLGGGAAGSRQAGRTAEGPGMPAPRGQRLKAKPASPSQLLLFSPGASWAVVVDSYRPSPGEAASRAGNKGAASRVCPTPVTSLATEPHMQTADDIITTAVDRPAG